MATISPGSTDLGMVTTGDDFSFPFTAAVDDPSEGVMVSLTITPKFDDVVDGAVTITNGVDSASIAGAYTNGLFPETTTKWLPKGKSDKQAAVTTIKGLEKPNGQYIFDLTADPTQILEQEYLLTATTSLGGDFTETYTLMVYQNYTPYKEYIDSLKASGDL